MTCFECVSCNLKLQSFDLFWFQENETSKRCLACFEEFVAFQFKSHEFALLPNSFNIFKKVIS